VKRGAPDDHLQNKVEKKGCGKGNLAAALPKEFQAKANEEF